MICTDSHMALTGAEVSSPEWTKLQIFSSDLADLVDKAFGFVNGSLLVRAHNGTACEQADFCFWSRHQHKLNAKFASAVKQHTLYCTCPHAKAPLFTTVVTQCKWNGYNFKTLSSVPLFPSCSKTKKLYLHNKVSLLFLPPLILMRVGNYSFSYVIITESFSSKHFRELH